MESCIVFADEKVKAAYDSLKASAGEGWLREALDKAFAHIQQNAFAGIQIPKNLIPKDLVRRFGRLDNLWKYNLPNAWRLLYSLKRDEVVVLAVVLEWSDHTAYERRFGYG